MTEIAKSELETAWEKTINRRRRAFQFGQASDDLLREVPYFYNLLQSCKLVWDDKLPAPAGVMFSFKVNGPVLYLNDSIMKDMDRVSYKCILWHELNHVALSHVFDFSNGTNKKLANISMDILINYFIPELRNKTAAIAKDCLHFSQFPQLDEKIFKEYSWEKIYDILRTSILENQGKDGNKGKGGINIGQLDGMKSMDEHMECEAGEVEQETKRSLDGKANGEGEGQSDDHVKATPEQQMEALKYQAAKRTYQDHGLESIPPYALQYLDNAGPVSVDEVDAVLQSFVNVIRMGDRTRTFKKPSRRFGALAKGRMKPRKPKLAILVDTSGSMGDAAAIILKISAKVLSSCEEVRLVAGDTRVHTDAEITSRTSKDDILALLKGGGGTILQPLFDQLESDSYSGVVLITDGYADKVVTKFPARALIVPGGHDMPGVKSVHLTKRFLKDV